MKSRLQKFFYKKKKIQTVDNVSTSNIISKLAMVSSDSDINSTEVSDYSYIGKNSIVHNTTIGKFCSIGPNVVIGYGDHPTNFISTSPVFYQSTTGFDLKPQTDLFWGHQQVIIGNDVWIGANCVIRNGVNIGDGAIIGAGAIVTKDVPSYAIAIGVPASIKRFRFDEHSIAKLLKLRWWLWDLEKIREYHQDFGTTNLNNFLSKHFND